MQLTQKELKENLKYAPETGVFTWVSKNNRVPVGGVAGTVTNGYMEISIGNRRFKSHRLAWLYVHGYLPEEFIDHIDMDKTNNRISNLREVSKQCNTRNTRLRSDNTSGVKGICWDKHRGKWTASITINGKKISLGRFVNKEEAVCHRLAAEQAEGWSACDTTDYYKKYVFEGV